LSSRCFYKFYKINLIIDNIVEFKEIKTKNPVTIKISTAIFPVRYQVLMLKALKRTI